MWGRCLKIIVAIIYKYLKYNIILFINIKTIIENKIIKIKIPYMKQG